MAISEVWDTRARSLASWKSQGMDRILYSDLVCKCFRGRYAAQGKSLELGNNITDTANMEQTANMWKARDFVRNSSKNKISNVIS